jgi:DNA-binding response OmpR family regulator
VPTRILIIDGEVGLAETLRHNLQLDGYEVCVEADAKWGVVLSRTFNPHLVVTDLNAVLGKDGVLAQFRRERETVPVLVLGSRVEDATQVPGYRLGLDEFMLRPVRVAEMHRRIDSMVNGSHANGDPRPSLVQSPIRFGAIEIHGGARTVLREGKPVSLRLKQFDLLMALVTREGRVASRLDLLREVWGYRTWVATRTVDTHIGELRKILERDPTAPEHILTVPKVGYRLQQ